MTMKMFRIVLRGPDGDRTVRVPSPTDAQAADAAAPLTSFNRIASRLAWARCG